MFNILEPINYLCSIFPLVKLGSSFDFWIDILTLEKLLASSTESDSKRKKSVRDTGNATLETLPTIYVGPNPPSGVPQRVTVATFAGGLIDGVHEKRSL